MSCSCSRDVVWARLGGLWRSLACRSGELSGSCGEVEALIGPRDRFLSGSGLGLRL
jgi:hypothetical protein